MADLFTVNELGLRFPPFDPSSLGALVDRLWFPDDLMLPPVPVLPMLPGRASTPTPVEDCLRVLLCLLLV